MKQSAHNKIDLVLRKTAKQSWPRGVRYFALLILPGTEEVTNAMLSDMTKCILSLRPSTRTTPFPHLPVQKNHEI